MNCIPLKRALRDAGIRKMQFGTGIQHIFRRAGKMISKTSGS